MPVSPLQRAGGAAEQLALDYLSSQGLRLVERNFRVPAGEIDLIMREAEELVFVEVRARASAGFGGAAASVTPVKQRRIHRAAQFYLRLRLGDARWPALRFDVVAFESGSLRWLRAAF